MNTDGKRQMDATSPTNCATCLSSSFVLHRASSCPCSPTGSSKRSDCRPSSAASSARRCTASCCAAAPTTSSAAARSPRCSTGGTGKPMPDALLMRFMGAVHRLVLDGEAPALARYYPSVGGTPRWPGDVGRVPRRARAARRRSLRPALDRQVQTNEVRRSAALLGGFLTIAAATGKPLRLLEIGSSAGPQSALGSLSLRAPRLPAAGGARRGRADRADLGRGRRVDDRPHRLARTGVECSTAAPTVVARRGCDLSPIDVADPDQARRLESFIWGDQLERLTQLRAAIAAARRDPPQIERRGAADWLAEQLAQPRRRRRHRRLPLDHVVVHVRCGTRTRHRARRSRRRARHRRLAGRVAALRPLQQHPLRGPAPHVAGRRGPPACVCVSARAVGGVAAIQESGCRPCLCEGAVRRCQVTTLRSELDRPAQRAPWRASGAVRLLDRLTASSGSRLSVLPTAPCAAPPAATTIGRPQSSAMSAAGGSRARDAGAGGAAAVYAAPSRRAHPDQSRGAGQASASR